MTTIALGSLSQDTLTAFATWAGANANQFASGVNEFIEQLVATREINFSDVGDQDVLNYLQWDYEQELSRLKKAGHQVSLAEST